MNILLGLTGSVASSLAPKLVTQLHTNLVVIPTEKAKHFYDPEELKAIELASNGRISIFDDESEWHLWKHKGDPVKHIDLRKWAHVFVIAPLTANTLAKIANGLCDNLLTSIARAWDYSKPLVLAPAMNTYMWEHPITQKHLNAVSSFGRAITCQDGSVSKPVLVVDPATKILACGDKGKGAMADINDIISAVETATQWIWPLAAFHHCNGLPVGEHPGAFGFQRKHDIHTGVDLYCTEGSQVWAMESGTVVKIIPFTGSKVIINGTPSTWWNDTSAILVEGPSGIICYGEVAPRNDLKEGDHVSKGKHIATVVPVIPEGKDRPDIPGHSRSMLHIELYSSLLSDTSRAVWEGWDLGSPKPDKLLDPTPRLRRAKPFSIPVLTGEPVLPLS